MGYGIYLYGMADNLDWGSYNIPGMDPAHCIFGVVNGSICAIASKVSLAEYDLAILEQRKDNLAWLKQKAEEHMEVLRAVMSISPVLPVKFCTIFRGLAGIETTLCDNERSIKEFLGNYRGKEEWSFKAYVDTKSYLERCVQQTPTNLSGLPPGTAYLRRKQAERSSANMADSNLAKIAEEILRGIRTEVLDVRINQVLSRHITQKSVEMFLNTAVLVDASTKNNLNAIVAKKNERLHSCGIQIELTGPWPAYNFCPVLKEEVQDARS